MIHENGMVVFLNSFMI